MRYTLFTPRQVPTPWLLPILFRIHSFGRTSSESTRQHLVPQRSRQRAGGQKNSSLTSAPRQSASSRTLGLQRNDASCFPALLPPARPRPARASRSATRYEKRPAPAGPPAPHHARVRAIGRTAAVIPACFSPRIAGASWVMGASSEIWRTHGS